MTKELPQRYKTYDDLPNHIKKAIKKLNFSNPNDFINRKIQILQNQSILEILNTMGEHGESIVIQHINGIIGGGYA